jgi:hypothetical protein
MAMENDGVPTSNVRESIDYLKALREVMSEPDRAYELAALMSTYDFKPEIKNDAEWREKVDEIIDAWLATAEKFFQLKPTAAYIDLHREALKGTTHRIRAAYLYEEAFDTDGNTDLARAQIQESTKCWLRVSELLKRR